MRRHLSLLDPDALLLPLHVSGCNSHTSPYRLTCEDYDALLWRSGNRCEICRARPEDVQRRRLYIDHDNRLGTGWNHVRGLVCTKCNSALRYVDNGFRKPTPEQQRYLDNAWFWTHLPPNELELPWLPETCKNPHRSLKWWDNPNCRWNRWHNRRDPPAA